MTAKLTRPRFGILRSATPFLRIPKREPTTNPVVHFCLSLPAQFRMSLDTARG